MAQHNELGDWGEEYAAQYLVSKGYVIKERNWRSGKRDIDIVALTEDGLQIVFVEVKTRRQDILVDPADAVTVKKMRSIAFCANVYLKMLNIELEPRFDIITIVGKKSSEATLHHIEDAFNPCQLRIGKKSDLPRRTLPIALRAIM